MKKCLADTEKLHGYKIKLYPTEEQKVILNRMIELYKHVYNWTISEIEKYYEITGLFMKINDACLLLKQYRNSNEWLKALPSNTARHAVMSAYAAYSAFFKKAAKRIPRIKTLEESENKYFKIRGERIYFHGDKVGFEGLGGHGDKNYILCKKCNIPKRDPLQHKYYNCTVKFDGYDYWLSFSIVKIVPMEFDADTGPIGVDIGLRKLAVLSDGTEYHLPDTKKYWKRRKKIQRQITKDLNRRKKLAKLQGKKLEEIPETKNMLKHKKQYRKICNRITNIKSTFIHTMTAEIVNKNPSAIVVETLNPKGMLKNKYLGKYLREADLFRIPKQLEYKSKRNPNIKFIKADRWYPSSQICSNCGNKTNVGDREIYKCSICGFIIDRDLNAAINLSRLANG